MRGQIKVFFIAVLALLVAYQAFIIDSSRKEKQSLKTEISNILKKNSRIENQLGEAKLTLASLKISLEQKTQQILQEQARSQKLEEQFLKDKEEFDRISEELNMVNNLKAGIEDKLQTSLK